VGLCALGPKWSAGLAIATVPEAFGSLVMSERGAVLVSWFCTNPPLWNIYTYGAVFACVLCQ